MRRPATEEELFLLQGAIRRKFQGPWRWGTAVAIAVPALFVAAFVFWFLREGTAPFVGFGLFLFAAGVCAALFSALCTLTLIGEILQAWQLSAVKRKLQRLPVRQAIDVIEPLLTSPDFYTLKPLLRELRKAAATELTPGAAPPGRGNELASDTATVSERTPP